MSILQEIIPAVSLIISYQQRQDLYHTWRVAIMATYLASEIIPEKKAEVFYAGLLHDIGLIENKTEVDLYSVPILQQALIPALKNHPTIGAKIVSDSPGFDDISVFIQDHHEWWDGQGYPNSKQGQEISTGGQVLRIADSFDIQLRQRPRPSITEIYNYFRIYAGREYSKQFWPAILDVKSKEGGRIFHKLFENINLPMIFEEVIKHISFPEVKPSRDNLEAVIKVLSRIVDAKDSYTHGHNDRVAKYSGDIAKRMGLSQEEIDKARLSGFLHDIGKVAIPFSILNKTGPLTKEEYEIIKSHAVITMEIIDSIKCLRDLSLIAGYDQERYDGKGYPDGLKGDEIPLLARILCVADAVDAMSSNRPYRSAMDFETIIKELKINSGTQFDPHVIEVAIAFLNEEGIT